MSTAADQRRADAEAEWAAYVRRVVDAMPPFTEQQRATLRAIFAADAAEKRRAAALARDPAA